MTYRPLTPPDVAAAPSWLAGRNVRVDQWRDHDTRALAYEVDGDIVAVGLMWTSGVHGDRYWCDITVAPGMRRRGIGTALLAELSRLRTQDLPFMTRGYVGDVALAFADALGARTIQVVPPAEVEVSSRTALPHAREVQVAPSAVVLGNAHAEAYEWTHAEWSPVAARFREPLLEGFTDEVDLAASHVAVSPDGTVLAHACVWREEPPLITGETVERETPEGERLLAGCVRAALDALADRGISRVAFDGHVTDPHLLPVLARLGVTGRWFRLVEVPAPAEPLLR